MLDTHASPASTVFESEIAPGSADPASFEESVSALVLAARHVLESLREQVSPIPSTVRADLAEARRLIESIELSRSEGSSLILATDGTWFEFEGLRVDVARRGAVKRILLALGRARLDSPQKTLSVDALFQAGWPGENIPYESQVRRVYTAVWTLRTLGLETALLTRDDGYLFDHRRAFHWSEID